MGTGRARGQEEIYGDADLEKFKFFRTATGSWGWGEECALSCWKNYVIGVLVSFKIAFITDKYVKHT